MLTVRPDVMTELSFGNVALLETALTHRSFLNEHADSVAEDNERLEFLGDAVLDLLIGEILYRRYADLPEGELTRLRAALVCTEALAEMALQLQLDKHMRMGKGEEASGGRTRYSNLCGAFEAVIGALYLDQGLEATRVFVEQNFAELLGRVVVELNQKDARSRLQEWSQAELNLTPQYVTIADSGPDHNKEFVVEVMLGEQAVAQGTGKSKRNAAQIAAKAALRLLKVGHAD